MLEKKKFYRMNNEQKGERFLIYERGLFLLSNFFDEIFIIPAIPNKIILISRIRLNVNP